MEAEGNHNENSKLWFSDNHVPLYMLREFELKAGISSLPNPGISNSNYFTNFITTRVKAYTGDVFSYLFHKGDVYPCTSCKKDVLFRFSAFPIYYLLFIYSSLKYWLYLHLLCLCFWMNCMQGCC
ncbi:hypothetical protein PAHAL_9G183700 [Panicum hallii]|uniref:Membrane-bound transcription factor PTM chromo domain-containing protein n=1 Tax=Panicum hallii TaxID=206008 RepID=A0A2T8I1T1_9POAL|nr:hypothetical protein PAHAL_9G183700 [Panicum hallii]